MRVGAVRPARGAAGGLRAGRGGGKRGGGFPPPPPPPRAPSTAAGCGWPPASPGPGPPAPPLKVEEDLPRLGLPATLAIPGDDAVAVGEDAEPRERPAADLPPERLEHATDLGDRHALLEQAAGGPQQDQVDEVEAQPPPAVARRRHQTGVHAAAETGRRQPDDAGGLRRVEVGASVGGAPSAHLLLVCPPAARGRFPSRDGDRKSVV